MSYEQLSQEDRKKIDELARRLRDLEMDYSDIIRYAVDTWYNIDDNLYTEVYFDFDINEVFVDLQRPETVHKPSSNVVLLFSLDPDWYDKKGPDLEKVFQGDEHALNTIKEMRSKNYYSDFDILEKLGYEPDKWIANWLIDKITNEVNGSLEEFLATYSNRD
jgi:hypothetical protein